MPQGLDVKDRRILHALSLDARQSLSGIGRKVGLSEEVVNYRLRNLIKRGIVLQFRTEIDSYKLGWRPYRIYIRLEGANPKKEKELFGYLERVPGADWVAACEGKYNIIVRFMARDEFALREVLNSISVRFSDYIREKEVTIPMGWQFYPEESGVQEVGKWGYRKAERGGPSDVDGKDMKLLGVLADKARATSSSIAGILGMTPNAVRHRMRRLEREGVIRGYQVVTDRSKLGMYHYKILLHFRNASEGNIEKFVRHCEQMPNLVFLIRSIGTWDMDVDFDFRNTVELHESVLELTSQFKKLIRSYETLSIFRNAYPNPIRNMKKIEGG